MKPFCDEEYFSPSDQEDIIREEQEMIVWDQKVKEHAGSHPNPFVWEELIISLASPAPKKSAKKRNNLKREPELPLANYLPEKPCKKYYRDFLDLIFTIKGNIQSLFEADFAGNANLVLHSFTCLTDALLVFERWDELVESECKSVLILDHVKKPKSRDYFKVDSKTLIKKGHYFKETIALRQRLIKHSKDVPSFYTCLEKRITASAFEKAIENPNPKHRPSYYQLMLQAYHDFHASYLGTEVSLSGFHEFAYHPEIWHFFEKRLVYYFKRLLSVVNWYLLAVQIGVLTDSYLQTNPTASINDKFFQSITAYQQAVNETDKSESIVYEDFEILPFYYSYVLHLKRNKKGSSLFV